MIEEDSPGSGAELDADIATSQPLRPGFRGLVGQGRDELDPKLRDIAAQRESLPTSGFSVVATYVGSDVPEPFYLVIVATADLLAEYQRGSTFEPFDADDLQPDHTHFIDAVYLECEDMVYNDESQYMLGEEHTAGHTFRLDFNLVLCEVDYVLVLDPGDGTEADWDTARGHGYKALQIRAKAGTGVGSLVQAPAGFGFEEACQIAHQNAPVDSE